jgi:NAD-reducing hydrogenase large subunit
MSKEIVIDPVTRIEGHSKITIKLDDSGEVQDALFHVTQLRGFEKFAEGRPFHEMPSLMARICGICPVSHLVASSKACDNLMSVSIPPTAAKLRRIMNLAQIAQSHALSFFYLSSPDMLLGMDADPAIRNIVGVAQNHPSLAKDGIALRRIGQTIIEILGGKRIHPGWCVPGGVNKPLATEDRDAILAMLPEAIAKAEASLEWFTPQLDKFKEEIAILANFPSLFMGLVGPDGELETYDGDLRIVDSAGTIVVDRLNPVEFKSIIAEYDTPFSYLKSPYYIPSGYPAGMYRVGPLARLHIANKCGTPRADNWFTVFKQLDQNASFNYHYARLVEILYAYEKIEQLLNEPDILSDHVRAFAAPNSMEGIGVSEAPRGTLMHHYKIDKDGLMTYVDLVIATGHNNLAMNKGITQAAKHYIHGGHATQGMLNRVEAVIRAYDPCLSCSTHADGHLALRVQLVDPSGTVVEEITR